MKRKKNASRRYKIAIQLVNNVKDKKIEIYISCIFFVKSWFGTFKLQVVIEIIDQHFSSNEEAEVYKHPSPPPTDRMHHKVNFRVLITVGLKSEFSFSQTGWLTKARELLQYYLYIIRGKQMVSCLFQWH